jgi:dTDP-4-amino-4,6-dideoxygalactose transaminase
MAIPFFDLTPAHDEVRADIDRVWEDITRTSQFIGGAYVDDFETAWAAYCGAKHCVGVANGTAALQLSLMALGVGVGDEVIAPGNTFIATAEAISAVGAKPVFVDVSPNTLLMTEANVRAAITPRTAAVIAVHLYGQPVDMDALRAVTSRAGVALIEDAAQAHGATWRGERVGSLSDVGCFSFYPGKNLGAFGDAGAVVTDDRALADRVRSLSNHGRLPNEPGRHLDQGRNERLDALQAAILSIKLKHLDAWNEGRRRVSRRYRAAFASGPVMMVETSPHAVSSDHLAVIRTPHRDEVRACLAEKGIGTAIHYPIPCHLQPEFSAKRGILPVAEAAADTILSLPMFPHLSDTDVAVVIDSLSRILTKLGLEQPLAS